MTTKKTDKKTVTENGGQGFEVSLKRLEGIVSEMEGGSLSLEDMISRFEEGQKLIRFCTGKLNEVERKIEVLIKKGDSVTTEPFEEDLAEDHDDDHDSASPSCSGSVPF